MRRYLVLALISVLVLGVGVASAKERDPVGAVSVDICHVTGNGGYHLRTVSVNALPAHLDHGDGLPEGPVPGMPDFDFDAECNVVADCGPTGCLAPPGSVDCDEDGFCEADLDSDDRNCGQCGSLCDPTERCRNGACQTIYTPAPGGYWDCDDDGFSEAFLLTDEDNCGQCGHVCPAGTRCEGGTCVISCAPGWTCP